MMIPGESDKLCEGGSVEWGTMSGQVDPDLGIERWINPYEAYGSLFSRYLFFKNCFNLHGGAIFCNKVRSLRCPKFINLCPEIITSLVNHKPHMLK